MIQLEEITAVRVDEGEMCSYNHMIRVDCAVIGDRYVADHLADEGVLINVQSLGDSGEEFQWMELRLIRELYRPRRLHRDIQSFAKLSRIANFLQSVHLVNELSAIGDAVHIVVLDLIIAVDRSA